MLGHTLKVDTMLHNETILKSESSALCRPPRCPRSPQTFYARIKRSPSTPALVCAAARVPRWSWMFEYTSDKPHTLTIFYHFRSSWAYFAPLENCHGSVHNPEINNMVNRGYFEASGPYPLTPSCRYILDNWTINAAPVTRDILQPAPSCCWDWGRWNARTRGRFIFVLFIHSHQHQQQQQAGSSGVQSSVILLVRQQYLLVISSGWEK